MKYKLFLSLIAVLAVPALQAQVRITEWMYNSDEFIEFTNLGTSSVNFANYSFQDSGGAGGAVSLAAFGTVASGESVLLTQSAAATFRTSWGLAAGVKIIGGNTTNLGRSDSIILYNGATEVDRLVYNDQGTGNVKGPRTETSSGWADFNELGLNNASLWQLSAVSDAQNSRASTGGFIGNPGTYVVPEPGTVGLLTIGIGFVIWRTRRSSAKIA